MKNQSPLHDQLISIYSRNREDSHATQRKRAWCLGAAARALTEKFGLQKLENLKQKHVAFLVERWKETDTGRRSIEEKVTHLRWMLDKIGKQNLLPQNNRELGIEPGPRHTRAGKTVTNERLGEFLTAIPDPRIQSAVLLARYLGLRFKEAMLFRPEKKLLAACTKGLADVVFTALLSGLRRGELFDLRRGDIDLQNSILTVVHGKGEKMRHIPIVPELKEVLERQPVHVKDSKPSPYVFNNPQTCTGWVDIKKAWARALRVAGIRDFRFHDLRHTFASRLVQRGVPIKAVQELLGHADIKMTMRYAHLAPHNLRDAVAVLSKKAKRPRRVGTRLAQTGKAETRETA